MIGKLLSQPAAEAANLHPPKPHTSSCACLHVPAYLSPAYLSPLCFSLCLHQPASTNLPPPTFIYLCIHQPASTILPPPTCLYLCLHPTCLHQLAFYQPASPPAPAGEAIAGEYVWGRYDLLLLPPSFPYGGMENPCLTFVTPTLLAGDR